MSLRIATDNGTRKIQYENTVVESLDQSPKLNHLRDHSRNYGQPLERLDLWKKQFSCGQCGDEIEGRFSSNPTGELLCWDCSLKTDAENDSRGVSHTTDPTKAVLSNSSLHHKNLCNYVINVATGCSHGCKFCYVPSTPNIKTRGEMLEEQAGVDDGQREWGSYLLYRDDLPERLARKLERKQKWEHTEDGRGVVMISSGTDCYQDRRAAQITRGCVIELVKHEKPVRILTRSPAVVRDLDVFKAANGLVTVGSSIPCLDDDVVRAIEPGAPAPSTRLNALEEISNAGVPVYVSMSPTYPTQGRDDLRKLLKTFKKRLDPDVVFHEPINPRGGNFDMTVQAAREAGQNELAEELESLQNREQWIKYSKRQLTAVEELGEELNIPVHLWPDKQFVKHVSDRQDHFRREMEKKESPEDYPRPPASA
ncbi:SPL family radical SAM protein [Halosimplex amylolyticum]|uniref:SPL family radical SAM protein n=1 Tax=Halosimplex amylolyticum TaxID=3396616 RepID=UPI003F574D17